MGFLSGKIALSLFLHVVQFSRADDFRPCSVVELHQCEGEDQFCDQSSGRCICTAGLVMSGTTCVEPSNAGLAAVVIVFVTALLMAGVLLIVRKYKLVDCVRQRLEARRNGDPLYEDVMIGNDDPPLTP